MYFSENSILRFLASRDFDQELAYECLVSNSQFYKLNNVEVLDESEFQTKIDSQTIVCYKCDKYGRPVVYMRLRLNNPDDTTDRQMMQYMLWTMKNIKSKMPKHVDNYLLIYDLKDAGWSNFSLQQVSTASKNTGAQFPEVIYKILILNSNW